MSIQYPYPSYQSDLTSDLLDRCCDLGAKLANEVGLVVRHEKFLDAIRNKPEVRIRGDRVHFDIDLLKRNIDKYIAKLADTISQEQEMPNLGEWSVTCGGFSMATLDIETDEPRMATQQDLRDLIKLVNSYGAGGNYPVMPQDVAPLMRALSCFKICYESADNIRPYDYLDRRQTPFLYEMHQVMDRPFYVTLCVAQAMLVDEKDLDIFFDFYPKWKSGEKIRFQVLDYPMMGITKPISLPGSITMFIAEMISVYTLFNTFDPDLEIPLVIHGAALTDMRHACWAWGHPRHHAIRFLNSRIQPALAHMKRDWYVANGFLESSSSVIDEQAAIERVGLGMIQAMQGARHFAGLGSLAVDDLFSAIQFVIDVEIIDYIREAIEAFNPPTEYLQLDEDTYDMIRDVSLGKDEFVSHPDTVSKFRQINPSSNRLVREKLRGWMSHRRSLKDRARDEAIERMKSLKQEFHLPDDKQKALDDIYSRAEKALGS